MFCLTPYCYILCFTIIHQAYEVSTYFVTFRFFFVKHAIIVPKTLSAKIQLIFYVAMI